MRRWPYATIGINYFAADSRLHIGSGVADGSPTPMKCQISTVVYRLITTVEQPSGATVGPPVARGCWPDTGIRLAAQQCHVTEIIQLKIE